jgi:hypothetical protein
MPAEVSWHCMRWLGLVALQPPDEPHIPAVIQATFEWHGVHAARGFGTQANDCRPAGPGSSTHWK